MRLEVCRAGEVFEVAEASTRVADGHDALSDIVADARDSAEGVDRGAMDVEGLVD